jgi:hypothetical protein
VRFLFGDYELDIERRELLRGSHMIPIGPQVFDLLAYLVENRERVVSKEELLDTVWGGRIVSESTLTSHINTVRKAIGDSGEEQNLTGRLPERASASSARSGKNEQAASTLKFRLPKMKVCKGSKRQYAITKPLDRPYRWRCRTSHRLQYFHFRT